MKDSSFAHHRLETARINIKYLEAEPVDGSLMIFIHGWPELGIVWHRQLSYFAAEGWHCIAPDMRGYGGSSVPDNTGAYAISEIVSDMLELHDALGGNPAVWVGHDWGSPVVWALAAHHAARCCAVVNLCVPYFARGFALPNLLPLIDRNLYPVDKYPVGQWDYFLHYRENFWQAARDFEADVPATIALLYRSSSPDAVGNPAITAAIRAQGGWFGPAHKAPELPLDTAVLSPEDYKFFVAAFTATGFSGADAWYMNDEANLAYAAKAPNFGRISLPVLFFHATWDTVCDTVHSRFADPMRADCADLTEVTIEGGHELQIERSDEVNSRIAKWLVEKCL